MTLARTADLLLVEPHAAGAELARRVLCRAGWRRVAVAHDGAETLELLQGDEGRRLAAMPRLVLLEPGLPDVDGCALIERIRAHPDSRMVPVVMFSATGEPREVARGYQAGANGVVPKPADFDRYAEMLADLSGYWLRANAPPP